MMILLARAGFRRLFFAGIGLAIGAASASAKDANPVAVFMGLDKITGHILTFDAYMDETVRFGSLLVRPRVCYDRPPSEPAQVDAFVEISDKQLSGDIKKIFSGWMFAASPGLNSVEHPVYDVWLYSCAKTSTASRLSDPTKPRDAQASAISGVAKAVVPGFDIPALENTSKVAAASAAVNAANAKKLKAAAAAGKAALQQDLQPTDPTAVQPED